MQSNHHRGDIFRTATIALGIAGLAMPAVHAQDAPPAIAFPDVPANHWAYSAVQDLANKGYVKGYPNATFLGNRALTRYEFATVIDRILQTLEEIKSAPAAPGAPQVTQDDLNKIQVLVDTFKQQLGDIQTDVTKAEKDIADLRGQVVELRKDVLSAKDLAGKAQATADNSFGIGPKRKFQISGFVQARYFASEKSNQTEFPNGTASPTNPYNGNYAKGTPGASFAIRRARIKFSGAVTKNTKFAIQLDDAGATSAVTAKEANFTYTFGDGGAKNVALTAGLFSNPFGYIEPLPTPAHIAPERPLAFSEGPASGAPFGNQDYERGAMLTYGPSTVKLTAAFLTGTGLSNGTDNDRRMDGVYRIAYQSTNKVIGLGASYYDGQVTKSAAAPAPTGKKQLVGFDAQYISPAGPFLTGEYMEGKFPIRTYFTDPLLAKSTTDFVSGNKIRGYYVQGGYTWGFKGAHPFTVAGSYDVFDRSYKGAADSGSSFRDTNTGYGVLYNLDSATRLKLWYTKPEKVAHSAGTAEPDKIGLFTSELQVKF